jgi:hypothetical protein
MADKKISQLPVKAAPEDADLLAIVDDTDSTTKQTTLGGVKTYLNLFEPTGGTAGQILAKNSATDYDTSWIDPEVPRLTTTRKATVAVSALRLVKFDSSTHISPATNDAAYSDAQVIGMALNSAVIGGDVAILLFGAATDAFFAYAVNDNLFLGVNGVITDIPPSAPTANFLVRVGSSMGTGAIFLNMEQPVSL